jgi:hypothetical protein
VAVRANKPQVHWKVVPGIAVDVINFQRDRLIVMIREPTDFTGMTPFIQKIAAKGRPVGNFPPLNAWLLYRDVLVIMLTLVGAVFAQ